MITREIRVLLLGGFSKPLHTIKVDGKEFIFECDVEGMREAIESLRGTFDSPRYRYQQHKEDPDVDITEDQHQKNVDDLLEQLERMVEFSYVHKIVQKAEKKSNGTFHKNRVYDDYTFKSSADSGSGTANVLKLKYRVIDDLVIRLDFHYTTELYAQEYYKTIW